MERKHVNTLLQHAHDYNYHRAIPDILVFIQQLDDNSMPTSIIICGVDDEISLFWESDSVFLDIAFEGDCTYEYEGTCGNVSIKGYCTTIDTIHHDVVDYIRRFVHTYCE